VYALAQRTYLILFWVGFLALFRGFSQIFMAFAVRHAGTEAAAVDAAGPPESPGAGEDSSPRIHDAPQAPAGFDDAATHGGEQR